MANKNCKEVTAGYELIVVECLGCGFHLGLDATRLAILGITIPCPICQLALTVEETE